MYSLVEGNTISVILKPKTIPTSNGGGSERKRYMSTTRNVVLDLTLIGGELRPDRNSPNNLVILHRFRYKTLKTPIQFTTPKPDPENLTNKTL